MVSEHFRSKEGSFIILIEIRIDGDRCLPGLQGSLNTVIESCVWKAWLLYAASILFLMRYLSGKEIKLKRPILVVLTILVGKNIGLSLLWPRIQVVSRYVLWHLGARVHDLLVLVHGSEGLGDVGMEGDSGGVVDGRRGITGWFK